MAKRVLTNKREQGQGNQCRTPGVKFKEFTGINRESGINLEETGKKNGGETEKWGEKNTMMLGRSTMVSGRFKLVSARYTMVRLVRFGKIGKNGKIDKIGRIFQDW